MLEIRDYLNEGGRVLYTGQNAGAQYTQPRRAALRPDGGERAVLDAAADRRTRGAA